MQLLKQWMQGRLRRLAPIALALSLLTGGAVMYAVPAYAVGTYDNATIATDGLTHLGQNLGSVSGQCKQFADDMVSAASGGTQHPSHYQSGWAALGTEVSSADATEGDIIQITPAGSAADDALMTSAGDTAVENMMGSASSAQLHTAIIVTNNGGGSFTVVDANFNIPQDYTVREHPLNPYTWAAGSIIKIWRLGTAQGAGSGSPISTFITSDGVYHSFTAVGSTIDQAYWGNGTDLTIYGVATLSSSITSLSAFITADGVYHVFSAVGSTIEQTYWGGGLGLSSYGVTTLSSSITSLSAFITADGVYHVFSAVGDNTYQTYWGNGTSLTTYGVATV